ncbi:MAG: hypothetical protein JNL36_09165 [Candidatus Kapabacteria bacterium]|nr:hypothetical protein [Candidatus Kapabacteria bacterium]
MILNISGEDYLSRQFIPTLWHQMQDFTALHIHSVLPKEICEDIVAKVYKNKEHWNSDFDGLQFSFGQAYYPHLEAGTTEEYFQKVPNSDEQFNQALPGLQEMAMKFLSSIVGGYVQQRDGWSGPGIHIFPANGYAANNAGEVHFDLDGISDSDRIALSPAITMILMLQPPTLGGGLKVWNTKYSGRTADELALDEIPSTIVEYGIGDLVFINSYTLHQIQPFQSQCDRISLTVHSIYNGECWDCWF